MMRLRIMAFTNILKQPVGWFDNNDSSPGCLSTKLARDAPVVKAVRVYIYHITYLVLFKYYYCRIIIFTFRLVECESDK